MRRLPIRRNRDNRDRQTRTRSADPGPRRPRLTKTQLLIARKKAKVYDWYGAHEFRRVAGIPRTYNGEGKVDYEDLKKLKSTTAILSEIVSRVEGPPAGWWTEESEIAFNNFYPKIERRRNLVQYLHDMFLPIHSFPMNKELHQLKGRYLGVFDVVDEKLKELELRALRRIYIHAINDEFLGELFSDEIKLVRDILRTKRTKVDDLLTYDPSDPNDLGLGGFVPDPNVKFIPNPSFPLL
ncbi:MAG TPA: hypothetical protein DCS60_01375 [Opitutae bacterium]|nr:hypothetical protein [Opitutae bacterium]